MLFMLTRVYKMVQDFAFCKQYHFESIVAMSCYASIMSPSYRKKEGAYKCKELMIQQGLAEATARDYWLLAVYIADDLRLATYRELTSKNAADLMLSRIKGIGIDSIKGLKFYKAFNPQKMIQELSMMLIDDFEVEKKIESLIENLRCVNKGVSNLLILKEIEHDLLALRAYISVEVNKKDL